MFITKIFSEKVKVALRLEGFLATAIADIALGHPQ
jgi:hypothetical protein